MNAQFVLFCKSYRGDAKRLLRLLTSIARHNIENIPLFVGVPEADLIWIRSQVEQESIPGKNNIHWLTDEEVVLSHPESSARNLLQKYRETPGAISQQVVKAEAWRRIDCENYLSIDSDTVFIRDFGRADFFSADGALYTVMHQTKDFMQLAINRGYQKVYESNQKESALVQDVFARKGPRYDFYHQPFIWSAQVWRDFENQWLKLKGWTIWDAIDFLPMEARWYGEALLKYKSIPLLPIEPLFRVYKYDWEYDLYKKWGERIDHLHQQYLGVVLQSAWDIDWDPEATRSALSKWARKIKRWLKTCAIR